MLPISKSANEFPVLIGDALIKGQNALNIGRVLFVFLRGREISAELKGVIAENLGHVVAVRVRGVGVVPGEVAGVLAEAAAIGSVGLQLIWPAACRRSRCRRVCPSRNPAGNAGWFKAVRKMWSAV